MSIQRDGPNPLRPYYKPPSIGIPQEAPISTSSGTHGLGPRNGSAASYASSARDIFSEMDYSDYLSDTSPSALESIRKQIDDWLWKYTIVLLAQPFDVAKTILQVKSQALEAGLDIEPDTRSQRSGYRESVYDDYPSDDSDPDEPAYFTSTAPSATSYSPSRSRRRQDSDSRYTPPPTKAPAAPQHQLILKRSDSILEVISQEWTKEGAWGVWKGSNSTFVYNVLLQIVEKWSRGLLSALLNLPDSVGIEASAEMIGGPYPWASLGLSIGAAVMAGVMLAPLDLLRTKLIITPTSAPKRSLMSQLRTLQSYFCPSSLIAPTILHSMVSPTISHSTPLLLRSHLGIDRVLTPSTYQFANFVSKSAELFLKLPLETILRRAQVSVLKEEVELARAKGQWEGDFETTVKTGEYKGIMGTIWLIVREEGSRDTIASIATKKVKGGKAPKQVKGQGLPGLWRGWRVGMWGLVGIWGSEALNIANSGHGGEF